MRTVLLVLVALAGCLLPDPPPAPRYFTPAPPSSASPRTPVPVRMGIVRSPLHLRESMTWRRSEYEYGFYDQRRWTDLPATYVEHALTRELFATTEPVPAPPGAPVMNVDVWGFEEVLEPVHEARVLLAVDVRDDRCVRLRRTFAASRPLDGDDPSMVARGIGEALDEVVRAIGDAVRSAASRRGACRG